MTKSPQSVFFDLDGTLLDTAPDLFATVNYVLAQYDRPPVEYQAFRPSISGGTKCMIQFAFNINDQDINYSAIREQLLQHYREHIAEKTELFPGMPQFLEYLEKRKILWGVVTNKPKALTHPLMDHFKLTARCAAIVSGDTLKTAKPNPEPLLYACQLANADAKNSIYIGDTESDIIAAKAAKMASIAVTYGYCENQNLPYTWDADYVANHSDELIDWLDKEYKHL